MLKKKKAWNIRCRTRRIEENGSLLRRNTGVRWRKHLPGACLTCSGQSSGGSHSDSVILNERGEQVGSSSGLGTNPWGIGFDRAVEELATMVKKAKTDAGIPQDKPLDSLVSLPLALIWISDGVVHREWL